jgi:hypothetical protein
MSRKEFSSPIIIPETKLPNVISSEADVREYIKSIYIPDATEDDITQLLNVYPADITQGSPYDTGILDALSPQFKRLASFQGDAAFQVSYMGLIARRSVTRADGIGSEKVFYQPAGRKARYMGFL